MKENRIKLPLGIWMYIKYITDIYIILIYVLYIGNKTQSTTHLNINFYKAYAAQPSAILCIYDDECLIVYMNVYVRLAKSTLDCKRIWYSYTHTSL